tara:strand:- start:257 stop:529 length:273 start_codon:yes stop_codon:yes gene_type:complete
MKKYIAALALVLSAQSFAVSNCLSFPVMNETEVEYKGTISEESVELSFGDCTEKLLVNDERVFNLYMLKEYKGEKRCVYKSGTVLFMCEK